MFTIIFTLFKIQLYCVDKLVTFEYSIMQQILLFIEFFVLQHLIQAQYINDNPIRINFVKLYFKTNDTNIPC